uniref:Putative secreted protein n=1 Tax=Anopheles darlingi TaxID=43151 RepID=A0A2M4D9A6_ANODA
MLEVDMLLWVCLCVCVQQCNWRLACCFGASSSLPPSRRRRRRTQCAEGAQKKPTEPEIVSHNLHGDDANGWLGFLFLRAPLCVGGTSGGCCDVFTNGLPCQCEQVGQRIKSGGRGGTICGILNGRRSSTPSRRS